MKAQFKLSAPILLPFYRFNSTNNYISEFEVDENSPVPKKVRDSITLVGKEIKKVQIQNYSNVQTIALLDIIKCC
jgi:hypothetical protein